MFRRPIHRSDGVHPPGRRALWTRRAVRGTAPVAAAALLLTALATGAGAVDRGTFELDGNPSEASGLAGDDWSNALTGLPGFNPDTQLPDIQLANTGVVVDQPNKTIFTGGGSKDDLNTTQWRHTDGSVPDKDEITNSYAAAYSKNNDLVIYFGADRLATNGNAALGFWFFQKKVGPLAGGTFSGEHTPGDLLVLSEFTNGGSQPTIQVYEWRPGPGAINGTLRLLTSSSSTCNATQTGTSDPSACAIVNTGTVDSPWPYVPKSGTANKFAKGAFFEGGINVTALVRAANPNASVPCISSFIAETRSSQSVDATLKDFNGGDFDVCSADITIGPSAVNAVGDPHTFTVKVTKTVAGTTTPVQGANPVVTLTASSGAAVASGTVNTCASPGTNAAGECTVTFKSNTAGIIVGSASVTFTDGGNTFSDSTGTTAATGAAVKRYVDARISINPPLDTNSINESHRFTVKVEADDGFPVNEGDLVNGFKAVVGATPSVTLSPSAGASITPTGNTCAAGTGSTGECTVDFTSATERTVEGTASVTLTIGGVSLTRATNGSAQNSGKAVKHFVDGSLTWYKVDQSGNPLGGATFEVCQTKRYDSAAKTHTLITPALPCVSVVDNTAQPNYTGLDVDASIGTLKMTGLEMGTYTVRETAAPAGYSFDPNDVKTAELETELKLPDEVGPDAVIQTAFVNRELFKMIVITCNQVTNELVVSKVTVNGVDKDTIGSVASGAANPCDLGGAKYENLVRGTYTPSVVIPKPVATP